MNICKGVATQLLLNTHRRTMTVYAASSAAALWGERSLSGKGFESKASEGFQGCAAILHLGFACCPCALMLNC